MPEDRGPEHHGTGSERSARTSLDDVLMTLVIEFLFFLENADPKDVAPAAASRMAQEIAFQVGRLPPSELQPFITFVQEQAALSGWPEERAFLEKLPGYLGWGRGPG
jgi:hypothetical protein